MASVGTSNRDLPADMLNMYESAALKTMTMRHSVTTDEIGAEQFGEMEAPRVLVVDDNPSNLAVFQAILTDANFELVMAQSGVEAMRHLLTVDFAAILLDINMPTLDGIQTAQLIRERERSRDVPIIFITAYQPDQAQGIIWSSRFRRRSSNPRSAFSWTCFARAARSNGKHASCAR